MKIHKYVKTKHSLEKTNVSKKKPQGKLENILRQMKMKTYQNSWAATKAVLRGRFIAGNTYVKGFPGGANGKELTCQYRENETQVQSLGREDRLEKSTATIPVHHFLQFLQDTVIFCQSSYLDFQVNYLSSYSLQVDEWQISAHPHQYPGGTRG